MLCYIFAQKEMLQCDINKKFWKWGFFNNYISLIFPLKSKGQHFQPRLKLLLNDPSIRETGLPKVTLMKPFFSSIPMWCVHCSHHTVESEAICARCSHHTVESEAMCALQLSCCWEWSYLSTLATTLMRVKLCVHCSCHPVQAMSAQ